MKKFLLIDIGAGTMDILCFDRTSDLHYKAITKSPVVALAEKVDRISGNLFITGCEMGGGNFSNALKQRARKAKVVVTRSASATIHHDPDRVLSLGIEIVADEDAGHYLNHNDYTSVTSGDLDISRLEKIVNGLGLSFEFDVIGVCAQDHGIPPKRLSHLDYRHEMFQAALDKNPRPEALLYRWNEVPATFNRLTAIARTARLLPAKDVYVMDSGMAAVLGASLDPRAHDRQNRVVIDVATSHTICAALQGNQLAGFFEYHTRDITRERLEELIPELTDGKIDHTRILKEGGHGAYLRNAFGFRNIHIIVVTGPKRRHFQHSKLPLFFGAPLGDNMMTGTAGLLEAICRRTKLEPIAYV